MVYGRPVGISHVEYPASEDRFPSIKDDKFIVQNQPQPSLVPSRNAFFVNVVRLYHLMDHILESLHSTAPVSKLQACTCCAVSQLSAILQLDALLLGWHENLPAHLKFSLEGLDDDSPTPFILQRQKNILKTRFLGMRILLHRQSVLFLLQSSPQRKWPRNTSRKWPPLFSDASRAVPHGGAHTNSSSEQHSPLVETQLARISAGVCAQMAQLQIESIDINRPLGVSGAWWWDFHCKDILLELESLFANCDLVIFNALCVLFGVLGGRSDDVTAVIPNLARNKDLIRRGFHNLDAMTHRGGHKVAQSKRFLRALLRTMTGQANDVRYVCFSRAQRLTLFFRLRRRTETATAP